MIGIELTGLTNLLSYTEKMEKNKLSKFKNAGIIAVRDIQLHFRNSEGQNGKWESLKYRSGKPLQKSGHLQQSISESIHSDNQIEVGTNLKYARIHNFGGIIKPKSNKYLSFQVNKQWVRAKQVTILQREFMWLSQDADNKIADVLINDWSKK